MSEDEDPALHEIRERLRSAILTERARSSTASAPASAPVVLVASSFARFLTEHPRAVIDVWAPWCGPCRTMAPILDALSRELAGEVAFGKLNADEEPTIAAKWNVEGIPTLLVFENRRLIDRVVGAYPHDVLATRLKAVFRLPSSPAPEVGE